MFNIIDMACATFDIMFCIDKEIAKPNNEKTAIIEVVSMPSALVIMTRNIKKTIILTNVLMMFCMCFSIVVFSSTLSNKSNNT